MIINILAFLLVLGILVMVHELGHFLAARFFGVRVDKFAFGFPPKLWSKKVGDTEYTLNLVPFGGYVSMYGEEGGHGKDPKSFTSKKPWQKALILAAGVFMNLVLAWVIFSAFYLVGGRAIVTGMDEFKGVTNNQHVYVTEVVADSPASKSGIKSGDIIVAVNGNIVRSNNAVFSEVQAAKAKDASKKITLTVQENGKEVKKTIDTYKETISGETVQRVGITMEEKGKTQAKWYLAPWYGLLMTFKIIGLTLAGLWGLVVSIFTKFSVGNDVGGPVAIYSLSGTFANLGFWALAQFIAILSISLALINIMPFPALDGGHIAILAYEGVTRKKIKDSTKQAINNVGFGLLLLLMVGLVYKDLARLDVFGKIRGMFK
jgi:regulator of sigma E protease